VSPWARRWVGIGVGLALGLAVGTAPTPEGLSAEGQQVAAVAVVMAFWWLSATLPLTVTAFVPLVAFPLLGTATVAQTAQPYAHPLIFLCLGGFIIGVSLEQAGVHERLTARLLGVPALASSPRRVLGVAMGVGGLVSSLVSNTATAVMMMPLALGLADRCGLDRRGKAGFALGLAYACSIGGVATLVGTFPNAVLVQVAQVEVGASIGFADWSAVGVPFSIVALPLAWAVVCFLFVPDHSTDVEPPAVAPWGPGQRTVVAIVGLTMAAWLTRKSVQLGSVTLPGWGMGLEVDDAWVAMLAAIVLFGVRGPEGRPFLDLQEVEARIPWSVLFLLGGGFALAAAIRDVGVTAWLAGGVGFLAEVPLFVAALGICLVVTFLTELTSNTATTQVLLPVLAAGAMAAGVDPLGWMVPATLSASCAFMLPVATPPNAVAAELGHVEPRHMAQAGLVLNLVLALWAAVVGGWWAPVVLGP
jgi:sodium-dependent dicarboxylate transporter 2/3/5